MLRLEQPELLMGFFYAFLGTLLFSLKSIFIKLAFAQGLETNSVLMLRMAISLPIYLFIMGILFWRKSVPIKATQNNVFMILFLGFIGYFLSSWLNLKGLEYVSVSLERLTIYSYPIFVAILGAIFFKSPITIKIILSLCLTYSGIWIVFNQEVGDQSGHAEFGTIMVLMAAFSFSLYVLFAKNLIKKLGSLWFTTVAMSASSMMALVYFSIFVDFSNLEVTTEAWLWVFMLAVVSTVLPSFMMTEAIHRIGPSQASIVGMLGPFFTISVAVSVLGEVFTTNHFIGFVLVMIGVMLLTLKRGVKTYRKF